MKLKTVNSLGKILVILIFLLLFVGAIYHSYIFLLFGLGLTVITLVFSFIFWRCPECGGFLGRDRCKYCRHCGAKLDL